MTALLKNPFLIKPICDRRAEFRTIDGTCNNFINPRNGAAKTPLTRLARNRYEDGEILHNIPAKLSEPN